VPLLVGRDVLHPLAEAGEEVEVLEHPLDHVLAGLGQAALDHDVVERDRAGQQRLVVRRLA
jgi:hypothetical protein